MSMVWTVLKINLLSLLSLPLLCISIAAKLLQKALEKAMVFLGVGGALLGMVLLNELFNHPGGFLNGLGIIVACFIVFGAIIALVAAILFFFGTVAAVAVTTVVNILMSICDFLFEHGYEGYSKLYDVCKREFAQLKQEENGERVQFACIFWYLLRGVNQIVVTALSGAFLISLVSAIGFALYALYFVHHAVSNSFGIGVFTYLKLFPTTNVVFTVINFIILVFSVVVVLISLGMEWSEWGRTLKFSTQNYEDYRKSIEQRFDDLDSLIQDPCGFSDGKMTQRCEQSLAFLQELLENLSTLSQQVDAALNVNDHSALAYRFAEYVELLTNIQKELTAFPNGIPCEVFEHKFIPIITQAKKQAKEIEKDVFTTLNMGCAAANNQSNGMDFFAGCVTEDEVHKRYKALCKAYHPDVGGHEATFQQLQSQYEEKIKTVSVQQ